MGRNRATTTHSTHTQTGGRKELKRSTHTHGAALRETKTRVNRRNETQKGKRGMIVSNKRSDYLLRCLPSEPRESGATRIAPIARNEQANKEIARYGTVFAAPPNLLCMYSCLPGPGGTPQSSHFSLVWPDEYDL